jgi:hypothetical protein
VGPLSYTPSQKFAKKDILSYTMSAKYERGDDIFNKKEPRPSPAQYNVKE